MLHTLRERVLGQWRGSLLHRTGGCNPRARDNLGWKSQEEEVQENQNAFPVIFCYTNIFEDQSPEDAW